MNFDADPRFASDNASGVSEEVFEQLLAANSGPAAPYGQDEQSRALSQWAREEFGQAAEIYPVFNGTGANVVGLQAALPRWGGVICTQESHINTDEGGAPERGGAIKLLPVGIEDGKLSPAHIIEHASRQGFVHAAQPLAISITQSTERGTVYTAEEVQQLADCAHNHGMSVHMDGSRLANAAAACGKGLAEMSADIGVDVLSLGATKNGAMSADAVVVIRPERVHGTEYIRKYATQLASKHRYLAAQLNALFLSDLWRRNADHANSATSRLGELLSQVPGVVHCPPAEVNALFPEVTEQVAARIQQRFIAHQWTTSPRDLPILRLMCSWQSSEEDLQTLVAVAAGD